MLLVMVNSLFVEGEEMVNSNLVPSEIVQFEGDGKAFTPRFVEPWTGPKDTMLHGVSMNRRNFSRQLRTAGSLDEAESELARADAIERTLASVARSHRQKLASVADIRRDIQTLFRDHFGVSYYLGEAPFGTLAKAYKDQLQVGTPLDQASMNVALSHLLFKEEEEARKERKLESEQADLGARAKMQEWMEQMRG